MPEQDPTPTTTAERDVANSLLHFDRLCGLADADTARRIVFALAVAGGERP